MTDEIDFTAIDKVYEDMADRVERPNHYTQGPVECIDAIQSALTHEAFVGFCQGNAIKYIWRYEHKGGIEDLEKANWYLARLRKAEGEPAK